MSTSLRSFAFAAGLALAAAGAVLAPTGAQAHGFHGGWGHGGWGHGGWGHGGWGGHWGHRWGYGPRYVYGGDCFLKRYVNDYGELVVRRVCY